MVLVLEQTLKLLGKKECKYAPTPPCPSDLVPVSYRSDTPGERNRPGLTLGWGQRRGKLFASSFFLLGGTKVANLLGSLQAVFPQGYTELPNPQEKGQTQPAVALTIVFWEFSWELLQLSLHWRFTPQALSGPVSQMRTLRL